LDDTAVDVTWPLLPSRTRPAGLLQRRLSEERKCDPQSVRSWWWQRGRPVWTSEQRDRASDLLRRESECCCQNGSDLLRREGE
jgi:hypothetical protein